MKDEMRNGAYFGLVLFFTLLLQSCASHPTNSEQLESQSNPKTQPTEDRPISHELRPWHSANYRGLEVGKSTDKDTLRVLGNPISIIETPLNNTAKGYNYGGADSLIVRIDRKSHIISWIETNPKNISKTDIIKEFGNNYMLIVYGRDPCFIEGKSSQPYVSSFEKTINTANTQSVVMEYRELGLSIRFRGENEKFMYDNEVYQINYFSDKWPIGTTSSLCDKPQKGLSFIACGCGCCGGTIPMKKCIYRSKGDDIKKLVEEDRIWTGPQCATVGCSPGIKYVYCD
ncbi:MAG: hypothetical protein IPL32_15625 [Chloracidobacterium sp.]|nr:hypothetical protein [Chloracidobacterium sp.]